MNPESLNLNIERSFNMFFHETVEEIYFPAVFVGDEERKRVSYDDSEFVIDGLNEWITIHFLGYGKGVTSEISLQITCTTRRTGDTQKLNLKDMIDKVRTGLNINSIPIKDYGSADSPGGGSTVTEAAIRATGDDEWIYEPDIDLNSYAMTYKLYLWRSDIVN